MTTRPEETRHKVLGLPKFPRLIFLDTNIVQNLHSFGEFIFDNSLPPEMEAKLSASGSRFANDIYALADFMALGHRAGWPIVVSSGTIKELEATPRPNKRIALTDWGKELAHYFTSHFGESQDMIGESSYSEISHFTFIQRCRLSKLLKVLPQETDRQLIIDALECGCDTFLTMDYKTIWPYRDTVNHFGLQVMRPVEILEHIRPWAGLLR